MSLVDLRGCTITGATPRALQAYESALAAFQAWRRGADELLSVALRETPNFVMAHALQAYLLLGSRDARRVRGARPVLEQAAKLPANEREQLHLAAIAAVLADDYEAAEARLGEALRQQPHDVLALQMAHAFDYITGQASRSLERTATMLPAWSKELPGYHAVLAMYAFSLVECGEYECAKQAASAALAQNANDARAHHVMAHVFEMTQDADAGVRWMNEHAVNWSTGTVVATHCWWHLALFHLGRHQIDTTLKVYDLQIRATHSREVADDGFCSFSDLHAMLAFVGAGDWTRALHLERALTRAQAKPTRHGHSTRQLGLPACRALVAFAQGDDALAIRLLADLPPAAHRLGGSHAQRDIIHLTLLRAVERLRRPTRRITRDHGCHRVLAPTSAHSAEASRGE